MSSGKLSRSSGEPPGAAAPARSRGRLRRAGGLLAGALVVGFLAWGVAGGWSRAARYHWHLQGVELALALVLLAAFNLAWGLGYVWLLQGLGANAVGQRRALSVWARSLLGRYIPGNVVMFAGRVILGRDAGVPASTSVAASLYEQIAMLAPAAGAATAFLLLDGPARWPAIFWVVAGVPLLAAVLDPAVLGGGGNRLLARLRRGTIPVPLSRRRALAALGWFALAMALFAAGTALSVRAVAGARSGAIPFLSGGFLLAWVLSMVAFVFPSGLGIREGAFAVVLARHLPSAVAISVAAASRLVLTLVELAVVGALVVLGRRAR